VTLLDREVCKQNKEQRKQQRMQEWEMYWLEMLTFKPEGRHIFQMKL